MVVWMAPTCIGRKMYSILQCESAALAGVTAWRSPVLGRWDGCLKREPEALQWRLGSGRLHSGIASSRQYPGTYSSLRPDRQINRVSEIIKFVFVLGFKTSFISKQAI